MNNQTKFLTGSGRFLKNREIFIFQILERKKITKDLYSMNIIKEITGLGEDEFKNNFLKEIKKLKEYNLDIKKYSFSTLFYKGEHNRKEVEGIYASSIPASIHLFIRKELWNN